MRSRNLLNVAPTSSVFITLLNYPTTELNTGNEEGELMTYPADPLQSSFIRLIKEPKGGLPRNVHEHETSPQRQHLRLSILRLLKDSIELCLDELRIVRRGRTSNQSSTDNAKCKPGIHCGDRFEKAIDPNLTTCAIKSSSPGTANSKHPHTVDVPS